MSRVIPPRTPSIGRVSGLPKIVSLVSHTQAGLLTFCFRPADAGRTDQTDQTDVRSISLCLLRLKSSTCSSHFNLEHRPTPTPLPIRAAMRNVRIKRMSRQFQIEHARRRRDIWAGGR